MSRAAAIAAATAAAAAAAVSACGTGEGFAPIARIDVQPAYVPADDGYATEVILDGSRSCDEVDRPDTCARALGDPLPDGLRWSWELLDESARLSGGARARAGARVAGDRPVRVRLTVTDEEGLSATARATIGIALPPSAAPADP